MATYMAPAATSALLRKALKESFPGVKFSVRTQSHAGGASADVEWTDGPALAVVKPICNAFEGAYFDGMIDYKGSRFHLLDGAPVHFGLGFVFERRQFSDAAIERALARVRAACPVNWREMVAARGEEPTAALYRSGTLWGWPLIPGAGPEHFTYEIGRQLEAEGIFDAVPSPTLARVRFAGDDGYGADTVGTGRGGEQCYAEMSRRMEQRA